MKTDRESLMKAWDSWRKYIAEGGKASWPRDAFESVVDSYKEIIAELEKDLQQKDAADTICANLTVVDPEICLACKKACIPKNG